MSMITPDMDKEDVLSKFGNISTTPDLLAPSRFPGIKYARLRYRGLRDRLVRKRAAAYWSKREVVPGAAAHRWIHDRIVQAIPTAVGRIGGVEASIGLWANSIGLKTSPFGSLPTGYWETVAGATNAGVRPRNKASYQAFGRLLIDSIPRLDMMGVWRMPYEYAFLEQLHVAPKLVDIEILAPSFECETPWVKALDGKTVLIVSPFIDSYKKQLERLPSIWPTWKEIPRFTMTGFRFPYLIDDNCDLTWWQVYSDVAKIVRAGQYDVALFGCGGLGLPLTVMARQAGKIGIHLGGHLQLLFGVYGNRFLEQEWHKKWINESWVRPDSHEVPQSAARVEDGCYW